MPVDAPYRCQEELNLFLMGEVRKLQKRVKELEQILFALPAAQTLVRESGTASDERST